MATLMHTPAERDGGTLRRLLAAARRAAARRGLPVLVSYSQALPAIDPLGAFAAAEGLPRAFWEHQAPDGTEPIAIAGIGAAYTIRTVGAGRFADAVADWDRLLEGALIELPGEEWGAGPLLLGGFSFDPARPRTLPWQPFRDGMLTLPRLTLVSDGAGCRLTANCLVGAETNEEQEANALARLREQITRPWMQAPLAGEGPITAELEEIMPGERWRDLVAETAREIHLGRYAKVVLARQARLALRARPASAAVRAMRQLRAGYPGSFLFAVAAPQTGSVPSGRPLPRDARRGHVRRHEEYPATTMNGYESIFLGASPERLLRLEGDLVRTAVLAGSARRGATAEEDSDLGRQLLTSAKDRHEHAVVAMMLRMSLAPFCRGLDAPETPMLLRLPNVQHLYTPVRGRLDGHRSILELVARLHPTPAVGGFPRQAALQAIREREDLDRGWYAAPVGWLDRRGQGEFAVAIRSALLRPRGDGAGEALLFAGCGIMGDSDPAREYAESAIKMQAMLAALRG